MKTARADDRVLLAQIVEESYRLPTWNGTNLRSALRRVSPEQAAWRPPGGRRSIAEIVLHCAYWKYAIRRQLTGDKMGSFGRSGSNWFAIDRPLTQPIWKSYLQLLDQQHAELLAAITGAPGALRFGSAKAQAVVRKIFGLAIHDAYHTGQVQLIKKLYLRSQKPKRA
jgi:hypothetical protein